MHQRSSMHGMPRRPHPVLLLALLAGCASGTPRDRAARRAREGREAELAHEPPPPPRSGVSAGGTRGPARRDLRPAFPTTSGSPAPADGSAQATPPPATAPGEELLLERPRGRPGSEPPLPAASDLEPAAEEAHPPDESARSSRDASQEGPRGLQGAPATGDGLAAAERWLDDAERWLDGHPVATARAERARVGRDLERLDADLDRQDAQVRLELAAKNDERRAALAEVERRAADRDLRERDALRAKHEPPIGVVVIPADEWKIRYQRDLALLIPVQERRLAAERAIVDARQDKEARPLHEEKQAISRVRFRLAVLLRRIEEGT